MAFPPDAKAKAVAKTAGTLTGDVETRRLVFIDGAFVPELSDIANLEPGVSIGSLADALATSDPALTGAVPSVVLPSEKVTVPVGAASGFERRLAIVAMNVTLSPV